MTRFHYTQLSPDEQADLLWAQGQFLMFRENDTHTFILYALDSFFVEVVASKPWEQIERLNSFCYTWALQPYLNTFQLSELYDLT